jgi:hypothetical protein
MTSATAMLDLPDVPLWTDRQRHLHAMQALSIDAALLRSLREPRFRGVVHSVFERVVNVEGQNGDLFTIASRDFDNAPNTLIVDTARFGAAGIDPGDRVDVTGSAIAIDMRIGIRLDRATPWHSSLPAYPADEATLRRNLASVRRQIGRPALGASAPAGGEPSALACATAATLERQAALLCAALCRSDLEAAGTHGHAMIGLGPGLTPSGDDFLVGLFAVLHLPGSPCRHASRVCVPVLAGIERRTHAISGAALKAAAQGRVRASIQSLLGELMTGSPAGLAASLSAVLAIGSTSGGDIAAGIVAGFEIHLQAGGRR